MNLGFFVLEGRVGYYIYILYSPSLDRYYIGSSHDPAQRLHFHNTSRKGWTQRGRPWQMVFSKALATKAEAQRLERWLKRQKSRELIGKVIRGELEGQI